MRVVIGSFSHESNTFNPVQMQLEEFHPQYGEDVLTTLESPLRSSLHGIYQVLQNAGAEIIPTVYARATPGGVVSRQAFDTVSGQLLATVAAAGSVDGVCLHLHGSMTVADIGDAEGHLLTEVRRLVGPDVPIAVSLDMHAMVTPAMLHSANAFVGFRTAPHVDAFETGHTAATLLVDSLQQGYQLTTAAVSLPMLVSGEQSETEKYPMNHLIQVLKETDQQVGILASSYFLGFPWADVPYNLGSAVVVSRQDPELAANTAVALAEEFWKYHKDFQFTTEAYRFEEALAVAQMHDGGLVCIADCGDNPGAGGSENIVYPLQHMLAAVQKRAFFGAIHDPAAVRACQEAGVGGTVSVVLGKLSIAPDSPGLSLTGTVKQVGQLGKLVTTAAAVLRVTGIDVLITEERAMMLDPQDLVELGLDLADYDILVLKSGYLDPQYEAVATKGLLALTPGFTNQIFVDLEYKQVPRPLYPLDKNIEFDPKAYLIQ